MSLNKFAPRPKSASASPVAEAGWTILPFVGDPETLNLSLGPVEGLQGPVGAFGVWGGEFLIKPNYSWGSRYP